LTLALPARAKLNLDLVVVGRAAGAYHEIRSTFQAIDLHDWLEFEPAATTTRIETAGIEFDAEDSSIARAQRALERAAGRELPATIHVHKRIPPGSGMGGASSDAAVTLTALKALYGLQGVDLAAVAVEVGADVPFFLHGGRATARGRGERLTPLASADVQEWYAIAWPGIELSTVAVYRAWDEVGGEPPNELRRAAGRVEPRLEEFAARLGAGWRMTGSGSAFFKPARTEKEARAALAAELGCWTAVARAVGAW
jgi:4-diphosphocytidyl-2-C-methyl-D-erythritol kinase